jgi:hypothetical protein
VRLWQQRDRSVAFTLSTLAANQKPAGEASQKLIQSPPTDDANDQIWQTFLDYNPTISEAVERLSSFSPKNVQEFRALLLQHRDCSRVKEFEDEAIRRVQGPAFADDGTLREAYINLNREDHQLGNELVRVVNIIGKPKDLERTVAQVRKEIEKVDKDDSVAGQQARIAALRARKW